MPLKLITAGGGSVILDANSTASTYTVNVPAQGGAMLTTGSTSGINASALSVGTLPGSVFPSSGINAAALTVSTLPKSAIPTGGILQVVNAIKTGTTSINAGSMTDVPGMSATITPISSSSNILILISVAFSGYASSPALQILRNSTVLSWGDAGGGSQSRAWHGTHWSSGTTNLQYVSMRNTLIHLDSPATTSSTTYKLQATSYYNNAVTINAAYADLIGGDTSSYMVRTASTITLMEVAG